MLHWQWLQGVLHGPGERRFRPIGDQKKARKPEIGIFVHDKLHKVGCMARMCGGASPAPGPTPAKK